MSELPTVAEVKSHFMLYSKDQKVSISKLNPLLKSLKLNYKETELLNIIDEIKPDIEGNFTVEKFLRISHLNPETEEYTFREVMSSLTIFDEDNDGKLTIKELETAMTQFGEEEKDGGTTRMNHHEFDLMKTRLDNFGMVDSNGMIDIEDLARMFLGIPDDEELDE